MIKQFSVKNYRNISADKLELGKINILIGPNGSGKSNFLKAMSFSADIVQRKNVNEGSTAFYEVLSERGWERVLNFNADDRHIFFSWLLSDIRYNLMLNVGKSAIDRKDFYIDIEDIILPSADALFQLVSIGLSENELGIAQINKLCSINEIYAELCSKYVLPFRKYLSCFRSYSVSEFNLKALKAPTDTMTEASSLLPDASNLVNMLLKWKNESYDTFIEYRKLIAPLFGKNSIDLGIDPIAKTRLALLTIGIEKLQYTLDDLSDGTLRAMILAALLVDRDEKDRMSVCAIDEPETNLHPEWQSRFCDWLLSSNSSQQYFISTHSPEILDPLTAAFMANELKVLVFSESGTITALDKNKIAELYKDGFNLGDLYRAKAIEIGGWS